MYCAHCGAENQADATFCQKCGKQLPMAHQDEPTIYSINPALATPYENTPYSNTPSTSADTVHIPPPPPSYISTPVEKASRAELLPAQKRKRRWGFILSLVIIVLVVIIAVGAYVYVNRSTPDKTVTTYYSALVHNDFQTAYDQFSTAAQSNTSEQKFTQIWQSVGGAYESLAFPTELHGLSL